MPKTKDSHVSAQVAAGAVIGQHQNLAAGQTGQSVHVGSKMVRSSLSEVEVVAAAISDLCFLNVAAVP